MSGGRPSPGPTQVLVCSTLFGSLTLAAALDAGLLGPRELRRIVLTADTGPTPEIAVPLQDTPGFAVLRSRVDAVSSYNEFLAPLHPSAWSPPAGEQPLLGRALERCLGLDGPPVGLVVESIAVAPSRTLATLLHDCPITVYSDGLMSYGPTRTRLPVDTASRLTEVLYLDLVPGLRPVLLREEGVGYRSVPAEAFTAVLAEAAQLPAFAGALAALPAGGALVLGQYLSALGLLSAQREVELYTGMVRAAARAGHQHVLFKPHPAAGSAQVRAVGAAAEQAGIGFTAVPAEVPAELCFAGRPDLVLGCFSTALLTARTLYGLAVAAMGTETMLHKLTPYQNSNRIPATIVDAAVPHLAEDGTLTPAAMADVTPLVEAVAFCMQPGLAPERREATQRFVQAHGRERYFVMPRVRTAALLTSATVPERLVHSRLARSSLARRGFVRALTLRARRRARRAG